MVPHIFIRKVDKQTIGFLIELIRKLAEYEKIPVPDSDAVKRIRVDCIGKNPKFEAYLLFRDATPLGYMILLMTYSSFLARPTLYIEDLFILEEERKNGLGKQLFSYAQKLARKRHCGRMEWIVLDWNTPAIRFYEKHDGRHMDEWRFYRMILGE
ncbi:MAG: hypothetical protein RLZZ455_670 [Candidatus Parcubacteria bacterium]|jgi:GNAT superfamily N-acetyltransferase